MIGLTPEKWSVISELLDVALDLPPEAREGWLGSLQGEQAALRSTLEELLARNARVETSDFLDTLPKLDLDLDPATGTPSAFVLQGGTAVGGYILDEEIGRGGMGTVWRAHRADGLIKRPVALKLLHPGLYSREIVARFDRERDILAGLAHPNIAVLYDAGLGESGQPFLALEHVEGVPLTRYCDQHNLNIRDRLELLREVLEAVQYAHGHLVIHRDLKPSNILVGTGRRVVLLDFGIAKLLDDAVAQENALTRDGYAAMTPDYASPEQLEGRAVGTTSDVYALGVVLYELLTGRRPSASQPSKPSEALGDEVIASKRATTATRLARALEGDLDTIVLKALKRSPQERYVTAEAFSQDLQRFLQGEPILARPDRFWYRTRKFVVRNRIGVSLGTLALLGLLATSAVALWQARAAAREAQLAKTVQAFLIRIFEANSSAESDPVKARGRTARELLDAGTREVDASLADAPLARLQVLSTLETLYGEDLGLPDQAVALGRKRVGAAAAAYGPNDVRVADVLADLAGNLYESSTPEEQVPVLAEAERILNRAHDFTSVVRANLYMRQAEYQQSRDLEQTIKLAKQSVDIYRRHPPSVNLANALAMEGIAHDARHEYHQAEQVLSEAMALGQSLPGNLKRANAIFASYLAEAQTNLGEFASAERSYRQALEFARRFDGPEHENVLQAQMRLGRFLCRTSRPTEGLKLLRETLSLAQSTQSAQESFHTPRVLFELGSSLADYGDSPGALAMLSRAIELRRVARGGTRMLAQMLEARTAVEITTGVLSEARADLEEATTIRTRIGDTPDSGRMTSALLVRARLAAAAGTFSAAQGILDSIPPATETNAPTLESLEVALQRAQLAFDTGDLMGANKQTVRIRSLIKASHEDAYLADLMAQADVLAGAAHLGIGHSREALELLDEAVHLDASLQDPEHSPRFAASRSLLARASTMVAAESRH